MAHAVIKSITKVARNAGQIGGVLKQGMKHDGLRNIRSIVFETSAKHSKGSTATLQSLIKTNGVKPIQRFNIGEMQRCLAAVDLISNVSVPCVGSTSGDGDMLEGSDEGDDVCSQGKKHRRLQVCTLST